MSVAVEGATEAMQIQSYWTLSNREACISSIHPAERKVYETEGTNRGSTPCHEGRAYTRTMGYVPKPRGMYPNHGVFTRTTGMLTAMLSLTTNDTSFLTSSAKINQLMLRSTTTEEARSVAQQQKKRHESFTITQMQYS